MVLRLRRGSGEDGESRVLDGDGEEEGRRERTGRGPTGRPSLRWEVSVESGGRVTDVMAGVLLSRFSFGWRERKGTVSVL